MVQAVVELISSFTKETVNIVPPCLLVFAASAFIDDGKYLRAFRQEFIGTIRMIAFTFSAGKWFGENSMMLAWTSHFIGVVAADYIGGGPHVNPACTLSMWCLGKCSYTEAYVRVAAQMGGGLVAFPLFHAVSMSMGWTPFGGPEFSLKDGTDHAVDAFLSEFSAMVGLLFLIYTVNWEIDFGTYHYWIKQSLTAMGIRALIELFPTAGPAINPMLATTWNVFGVDKSYTFPSDMDHYIVYWVAPGLAAIFASTLYAVYAGGTVWGISMPIGPLKKPVPSKAKTMTKTATKKD